MKAATVHELKEKLSHLSADELLEFCIRLARFKKENKELLTYLLFEAHDIEAYIENVKNEMDAEFAEIPAGNSLYLIKKSLRKILRTVNKYIRYTNSKDAEIQLLIYYCSKIRETGIPLAKSVKITNLYQTQLKKINKTLSSMHEDLQYDYLKEAERLSEA
ncbi:MAG: hypothetical protein JJE25_01100 [Bacteroidia bacterium]|nr:hypothetical protein [Bacteroidia bacterium]